ncbi:peroxiredoxin family protein [Undibacterium sp.]|uniref:peroxiredoxin family protein n=1 Tax=Undibacterium sp. TaxID=1914977 RepID=UPI003750364D
MFKHFTQASLLSLALFLSNESFAQQIKTSTKLALVGVDYRGAKIDLRDYAGKTILISFYSAGCSVCARDLKLMREFYRDNHNKNFVLIGVNVDKTQADFALYTKILSSSIPVNQQFPLIWRGNTAQLDGFGTLNIDPTHYLITPNGQLALKREGTFKAEDWDNLWESLNP